MAAASLGDAALFLLAVAFLGGAVLFDLVLVLHLECLIIDAYFISISFFFSVDFH